MKPHQYSVYIKSVTMHPVPAFNKARYMYEHAAFSREVFWLVKEEGYIILTLHYIHYITHIIHYAYII